MNNENYGTMSPEPIVPHSKPIVDPATKFVAKGAFGCVIDPALPNFNETTHSWKTPAHHVTKLFVHPDTKRAAVTASKKMYELTGSDNNNILVHPYKYNEYKFRNLPYGVQSQCELRNSIHPVHMKHLGVDATKLQPVVHKFHKITLIQIMHEMKRLMHQVVQLKRNGYIHGDIRETNVMFNVTGPTTSNHTTTKFTIIDYDWLKHASEFFHTYPLGFYSNPPESLLYKSYTLFASNPHLSLLDMNEFFETKNDMIQKYIYGSNHASFRKHHKTQYTIDMLKTTLYDAVKFYKETMNVHTEEGFKRKLFITFDSYGLGIALSEFCAHVYTHGAADLTNNGVPYTTTETTVLNTILRQLIVGILLPMCAPKCRDRITPEIASERITTLIRMYETRMTPDMNALGGPILALQSSNVPISRIAGGRTRNSTRNSTHNRKRRHSRRQKK